jgi:hypothetical protein
MKDRFNLSSELKLRKLKFWEKAELFRNEKIRTKIILLPLKIVIKDLNEKNIEIEQLAVFELLYFSEVLISSLF